MMRALSAAFAACVLAGGAFAQAELDTNVFDQLLTEGPAFSEDDLPEIPTSQRALEAPVATLRWLDKTSGDLRDVVMRAGETVQRGGIQITLLACRIPENNPSSDAYAQMIIIDTRKTEQVFSGWMVASSPALNALDHARYDVWVLRCSTS